MNQSQIGRLVLAIQMDVATIRLDSDATVLDGQTRRRRMQRDPLRWEQREVLRPPHTSPNSARASATRNTGRCPDESLLPRSELRNPVSNLEIE